MIQSGHSVNIRDEFTTANMDEDDFDPLVYLINMGFDAGTASRKGYILNSIIYELLYALKKTSTDTKNASTYWQDHVHLRP